ncbi:TPA: hypothetical protein N0F65_000321 [Lagenidium giganteum]|uniref:Uncharacterized protein n=1 Tax=Lagenidium giganteum TaxID=4803 RepID=A0AAV2YF09_9STRA|nr:TPA: hypothetical protein N0F65_000321 [Lagenidium giganteum]
MIGRADIEESKSNVAMGAWLPQASYSCVCIHTESQNQVSFYPFVLHEISVLIELTLGHLCYHLTDVPPQLNSPPDDVFHVAHPHKSTGFHLELGTQEDGQALHHGISKTTLEVVSSSTGSSFPADFSKPVPLAVVR